MMDNWCEINSDYPYVFEQIRYNQALLGRQNLSRSEIAHCVEVFSDSASWVRVLARYFDKALRRLKENRLVRTQFSVYVLVIVWYFLVELYCIHSFYRLYRSKIRFSWFQLSMILWDLVGSLIGFLYFVHHHVIDGTDAFYACLAPYVMSILTVLPTLVDAVDWCNLVLMILFCLDRIKALKWPVEFRKQDHEKQCLRANLLSVVVGFTCFFRRLTFGMEGMKIPKEDIQHAFASSHQKRYETYPKTVNEAICFRRELFTRFCLQEPKNPSRLRNWLVDAKAYDGERYSSGFCHFSHEIQKIIYRYTIRAFVGGCLVLFALSVALSILYRRSAVSKRVNRVVMPMIPSSTRWKSTKPSTANANANSVAANREVHVENQNSVQNSSRNDDLAVKTQTEISRRSRGQETMGHHQDRRRRRIKQTNKQKMDEAHERAVIISIVSESIVTVLKGISKFSVLTGVIRQTFVYELMYVVKLSMTAVVMLVTSRVYRKEFLRPFDAYLPNFNTNNNSGGGRGREEGNDYDLKRFLVVMVLLYGVGTVTVIWMILISLYAF